MTMERPAKRIRTGGTSRLAAADNEDELVLRPEEVNRRRDPGYQAQLRTTWLKSRFESIFEKYADPDLSSDEIDLRTGEVVADNGHIQALGDSRRVEDAVEALADEQDALILRGMGPQPPQNTSFLGIVPGIAHPSRSLLPAPQPSPFSTSIPFDLGPRDPKWQVPELPQLTLGAGLDSLFSAISTRKVLFKRPQGLLESGTAGQGAANDEDEDDDILLGISRNIQLPKTATLLTAAPGLTPLSPRPVQPVAAKAHKKSESMQGIEVVIEVKTAKSRVQKPTSRKSNASQPKDITKNTELPSTHCEVVAIKPRKEGEPPCKLQAFTEQTTAVNPPCLGPPKSKPPRKYPAQRIVVEIHRNIISPHEYQLVTPDDDEKSDENDIHVSTDTPDEIMTLAETSNIPEPILLDSNDKPQVDTAPPQDPDIVVSVDVSGRQEAPIFVSAIQEASIVPRVTIQPLPAIVPSRRPKRNRIDALYEFSDEDESTVLLPKLSTICNQRPKVTQSANSSLRYVTSSGPPTMTSSATPVTEKEAVEICHSDKENSLTIEKAAKAEKRGRKRKVLHSKVATHGFEATSAQPVLAGSTQDESYIKEAPKGSGSSTSATNPSKHGTAITQPSASLVPTATAMETETTTIDLAQPASSETNPGDGQPSSANKTIVVDCEEDRYALPSTDSLPTETWSSTDSTAILPHISSSTSRPSSARRNHSTRARRQRPASGTPSQDPIRRRTSFATANTHQKAAVPLLSSKEAPSSVSKAAPLSASIVAATPQTSLLSLITSSDEDEDELSLRRQALTPSSRRSCLEGTAMLAPSPSAVRKSKLTSSLAERSRSRARHAAPQTPRHRRLSGFVPQPSPSAARGGTSTSRKKRERGGKGAQSDALVTPAKRAIIGPEPVEELFPTPGGSMRRCGDAGFRCDRDFCMTCD